MKAVYIEKYGGIEVLQYDELPKPTINDDEILIRVSASSVNPVDWKSREGMLRFMPNQKLPKILGGDLAGTIENIGNNILEFKKGDKVYGLISAFKGGTYAEYAVAKAHQVVKLPNNINLIEAGTIPLAALTAYQSLTKLGNITKRKKSFNQRLCGGCRSFCGTNRKSDRCISNRSV